MNSPAVLGTPRTTRIVGAPVDPAVLVAPVQASLGSFFAPRGAFLDPHSNALWIADSGHHRVLGWRQAPVVPGVPADCLLGQADASGEGRNAGEKLSPAQGLNLPVGICVAGNALVIADSWNHRVLIWDQQPETDRQPPDRVLGQADLQGLDMNRGRRKPAADSLYWPYGVSWDGEYLVVCDAGNRRVLLWAGLPHTSGQPADLVLGQTDFDCRDENGGHDPDARGMRWPHAACRWQGHLCVADAGNHRIMVWQDLPQNPGTPADILLGQADPGAVHNNGGGLSPNARVLSMPYGVAALDDTLWVADTANSRLLAWRESDLQTGAAACRVFGQPDFALRGENRWQPACADSLCWPYGVTSSGSQLVIADSGNSRVLIVPAEQL